MTKERPETPFLQALFPILVLAALIVYGLIVRPLWLNTTPMPLEIIFILSAAITVAQLFLLGHHWSDIQQSIVDKLARALPAFFILFCIGLIIASWIVCGTIPMLVTWGLEIIDPRYLYVVAFIAPVVFSTLTGTSWGSVGTIGVVILGIATALQANLGITAGAIIGGAYFGDKMSPLSDTTNLAALAADVDLFDHIKSMMITTIPSAVLAAVIYFAMGFIDPPSATNADLETVQPYLVGLRSIFHFNLLLLLPPVIVLIGSLRKMPTVPVLISSVIVACVLALLIQPFTITDVVNSVYNGFNTAAMVTWVETVPPQVRRIIGSWWTLCTERCDYYGIHGFCFYRSNAPYSRHADRCQSIVVVGPFSSSDDCDHVGFHRNYQRTYVQPICDEFYYWRRIQEQVRSVGNTKEGALAFA